MSITMQEIPGNVLSVTAVLGYDTIFRDTPLSQQLGLEQGNPIPDDLREADVLLWVESAVLQSLPVTRDEVQQLREELKMSVEEFDAYLGLPPGTIAKWEQEGSVEGDSSSANHFEQNLPGFIAPTPRPK